MNSEALLEHSKFIRCLARSLVLDESSADDLTQKTWRAALKKPPKEDAPPMGWLSKVVHNLARMEKRSSIRRYKREKIVAQPEAVRSTEDVFERQAQTQLIFDAVMSLKDPYRSAILLRFYDEMPPRQIAREIGAPVTTVKTWLQRGQEQLRGKLDAEFGGDRETWKLALAPIAGLSLVQSAASATTATTATVGSGFGVAALKLGLVGLITATAAVLIVLWNIFPDGDQQGLGDLAGVAPVEGNLQPPDRAPGSEPGSGPTFLDEQGQRIAIEPPKTFLSGRVADSVTGEPIEIFDLKLSRRYEIQNTPASAVSSKKIVDGEGLFSLPFDGNPGRYVLYVKTSRHKARDIPIVISSRSPPPLLEIELDPGFSLSGRVVDSRTGDPIENAIVGAKDCTWLDKILLESEGGGIHDRTGKDGYFTLEGLGRGATKAVVSHPDYAQASTVACAGSEEIAIGLERGCSVFGLVSSHHGTPIQGAVVTVWGENIDLKRVVLTGPDGQYRTPPLAAGSNIYVRAESHCQNRDGGLRSPDIVFIDETRKLQIHGQDVEINFEPSKDTIAWQGTFYDELLVPVKKGIIQATPIRSNDFPQSAHCDDEGRFEFRKIRCGIEYYVTLYFPDYESQIPLGIHVFTPVDGNIVTRDLYASGGSIEGQISLEPGRMPAQRGSIRAISDDPESGSGEFRASVDDQGLFRLRGMPPGTYSLTYLYNPMHPAERVSCIEEVETESGAPGVYEIDEDQAIRGVRLFVPAKGTLSLAGAGYLQQDLVSLMLKPIGNDTAKVSPVHVRLNRGISSGGDLAYSCLVQQGSWTAEFFLGGNLAAQRDFDIFNEKSTMLVIDRNELQATSPALAQGGTFRDADGFPVGGAELTFTSSEQDLNSRHLTCTTNTEGVFSLPGLAAGQWDVSARLPGSEDSVGRQRVVYFRNITVAEAIGEPAPMLLAIPSGKVRFRLRDRLTGQPVPEKASWKIYAFDDANRPKTIVSGWGSEVEVAGLPEGLIRLRISAPGYTASESPPLMIADSQDRHIGDIDLEKAE